MKHFIDTLSVNNLGQNRVPEPTVLKGSTVFLSDGSGGLILDHLYFKTPFGIYDLTGAVMGSVTGAQNVGGYNEVFKTLNGSLLDFRTIKAGSNITITQTTDYLEINSGVAGYETLNTSLGIVISDVENTEIIIDTFGITSSSIPDGTFIGQKKSIFISDITLGGKLLLSANLSSGSLFTFDTIGQSVILIWNSQSKYSMIAGNVLLS